MSQKNNRHRHLSFFGPEGASKEDVRIVMGRFEEDGLLNDEHPMKWYVVPCGDQFNILGKRKTIPKDALFGWNIPFRGLAEFKAQF